VLCVREQHAASMGENQRMDIDQDTETRTNKPH
jgi:hypothetical protein